MVCRLSSRLLSPCLGMGRQQLRKLHCQMILTSHTCSPCLRAWRTTLSKFPFKSPAFQHDTVLIFKPFDSHHCQRQHLLQIKPFALVPGIAYTWTWNILAWAWKPRQVIFNSGRHLTLPKDLKALSKLSRHARRCWTWRHDDQKTA